MCRALRAAMMGSLNIRLVELTKRLSVLLGLDAVRYGEHTLPAAHLRLCGIEFRDDARFFQSACTEADRLIEHLGLGVGSALLDIGCGFGRLAIGVLDRIREPEQYCGVDVSEAAVAWCNRRIARTHPAFRFVRLDVKNERYNPRGKQVASTFRLPFGDGAFDIGYAYSVFSHMELTDVEWYLVELRRVLRAGGGAFVTLFVADNVPDVTLNPADGDKEWRGPLHCVRYGRAFIESRMRDAGFTLEQVTMGTETDGQSGYYLRRTVAR
jgi:SAM-dependent methyltransferase